MLAVLVILPGCAGTDPAANVAEQGPRMVDCSTTGDVLAACMEKAASLCPNKFDLLMSEGALSPDGSGKADAKVVAVCRP